MKSKTSYLILPIIGAALLLVALFSLPGSTPIAGTGSAQAAPEAFTFTAQQLTTDMITDTFSAIAVDSNGKAHIAYERDGDIYYITNASGSWITTTLAADGHREFKPSIAVDSSGYVHIAHYAGDSSPYWLYYLDNTNGGAWGGELIQTVSVPHPWHLNGGIALDGAGRPYVVYVTYDGNDYEIEMRYHDGTQAYSPNGGWDKVIITDNTVDDDRPSIAVQSNGSTHIAYQQDGITGIDNLYYTTNVSGSWATTEVVGSSNLDETNPFIALDKNQKPHIAYSVYDFASGSKGISYAALSGSSWITSSISSGAFDDHNASIIIDNQNKAHIVYSHYVSKYQIVYATNASSAWVTETLTLPSDIDRFLTPMDRALAIDSSGYLHITYYSGVQEGSDIYYAKSDQPAANNGTCAAPLPIACGQQVAGETTGKTNNINSYSCSPWNESGPEEIYAFTLAAGDTYSVTAQLLGFSADLDLFLLGMGGCDAGQCLDVNSWGDFSASATGVAPGTYYIAVDGYNGADGSYTMRLTCETEGGGNQSPNTPSNPAPTDNATGVSLNPTLDWTGGDPDGDPVTYIVHLIKPNLQFYVWCQTTDTTSCADQSGNPPLQPNTNYSWQVAAQDDHLNGVTGPIWYFTTVSEYKIYLPLVRR